MVWKIDEIEKFIRAFSTPYPGAFTCLKEKRISLLDSEILEINSNYHPFMSGRVEKIDKDGNAIILGRNGKLLLKSIM